MAHLTGNIKSTAAYLTVCPTALGTWLSIAKNGLAKTGTNTEYAVRIDTLLAENEELRTEIEDLKTKNGDLTDALARIRSFAKSVSM